MWWKFFFPFLGNLFWRTRWTYNCELFSTYLLIFGAHFKISSVQNRLSLLNYTATLPVISKKSLLRWLRLQAFCLSETKKSNGILICEIRTSLWTRIIKQCWKLNFQHFIEYFFVNFGVFLWLLRHEKNGSMNQNYPSSACVYMSTK